MTVSVADQSVTGQDGDVKFEFIADRPVLDFVSTLASRGSDEDEDEKLRTDDDLAEWIILAGIVDTPLRPAAGDLERARALRESMFRLLTALIDHRAADPVDRAALNEAAAVPLPALRLDDDGVRREGDLAAVLAVLARDCIDLHGSPDRELLRWCADLDCTRTFIDRSRGTRRRWCGMKGCGDRAKAAAYRERQRAAGLQK